MFLNYFKILILKIIFKKLKYIINMYFNIKSYIKNNHNFTANQSYNLARTPRAVKAVNFFLEWTRTYND